MAAGKIALQKASGGVTTITGIDGTGDTELRIPERGVLAITESPAFTETPTAPTATAGTNTTQLATTAYAMGAGIGSNQTWQDVTASRSAGTTYTNSTGKPIFISIVGPANTSVTRTISLTIDSKLVMRMHLDNSSNKGYSVSGLVPNGSSYFLTETGNTFTNWSELR